MADQGLKTGEAAAEVLQVAGVEIETLAVVQRAGLGTAMAAGVVAAQGGKAKP